MYGYNNKTNPYLEGLVQDSLLFVFENAISPATTTIPSIQSILSTYNPNIKSDLKWYECTTLINMMKSAGYETTWISNQSPKGMYDNTAARYAELCDSIVWVGSKFTGISKKDYDELLVNTLCEIDFNDESKHFVVIHMMGSHCDFKDRYPEEWSIFDEMDYDYLPINQKSIIASYDNSILYNDYVVSQILNLFYDKESIAFYFPDHGLDVYESTDDYCGHAIQDSEDSKKVAKRIPFVVYCSPEFSDEFSVAVERIKASRKGEYCTSDVKTLIMDCIGAEILSSNL